MQQARHWLPSLLVKTLFQVVPTFVGILLIMFVILKAIPGDAVDVLAGESGGASAASMALMREQYGLNLPAWQQFLHWGGHILQGNLGYSPRFNTPVNTLILSRLPATLMLMLAAQFFALIIGVLFGVIMALFVGRWPDRLLSLTSLLLYSLPGFWIGLMLLVLFSVHLGWLPSSGNMTIGSDLHGWAYISDRISHAILPVFSLASFFLAIYARLTRAAMLEITHQDFVRTAHAKGLSPLRVTLVHVLRCALIPLVTVSGMHIATLLSGAAVVETVFSWPGLGRLALDAVMARDVNILLGILLFSSLLVLIANFVVDLIHAWLDPRVARH
ncbi:ABC transporter permease [Pantoea rodasii]|uniref:ABC transporter permease n=1 Tax=Pantoea rodasii TaxID=1076549 RepID=A0A2M9W5X2_9GAMM|nr:ABC transporter permease [Pantoea rodasii]ORM65353.1 ABC transporter permease [Pantoea rodasii]PJZ02925.1 ABC transporter permease [Pantoea rodasii]